MKVIVRGKNKFEPGVKITDYASEKIQKLDQYFRDASEIEANVLCKAYSDHKTVEITIPTKNIILRAEVNGETIYEALDGAVDRIESQIKRHKNKLAKAIKHREGVSGHYMNELNVKEDDEDEVTKLFKEKKIEVNEMDREDAITQMEMLGHDFFLFIDAKTHKPSVVYLRNDGNYGVIEAK